MLLTTATLTPQRRQVYLMIDEFQRVAAHNVDAILQIARSMSVGVILANQSIVSGLRFHKNADPTPRQPFRISTNLQPNGTRELTLSNPLM